MLGVSNFDYTEVVSGLKEGEQVACWRPPRSRRSASRTRIASVSRPACLDEPAAGGGGAGGGAAAAARGGAGGGAAAAVAAVVAAAVAADAVRDPRRVQRETSMLIGEIIRVALGALRANKLRSLLTMLGIVIGVAAVIAMVALGNGAQKAVKDRISSLGTTLLTVMPGQQRGMGGVGFDRVDAS